MKLSEHLAAASRKLAASLGDDAPARLEAEILLAHALEAPRSFLYAHGELELPHQRHRQFHALVARRARGEPIAYLTGEREFWSLTLKITPDVLIPRPETELLVEEVLRRIDPATAVRVADLGTGSGAVALAIASERPEAEVHGTDISASAVDLARRNARRLKLATVQFHQGSWCQPLSGRFDVVVSNPPYVAANDPHLDEGDCRFEPTTALSPGLDSLSAFEAIAGESADCLETGGWLLFEHGADQGAGVREVLVRAGFTRVRTLADLEGRDRVSLGRRD